MHMAYTEDYETMCAAMRMRARWWGLKRAAPRDSKLDSKHWVCDV